MSCLGAQMVNRLERLEELDRIAPSELNMTVDVGGVEQVKAGDASSRIPVVSPVQDLPEPDAGSEMPQLEPTDTKP